MFGRKKDIDLEVVRTPLSTGWDVRIFKTKHDGILAHADAKDTAIKRAAVMANALAHHVNRDGSCEVYIRNLDGSFAGRSTYGKDPKRSKG